MIRSAITAFLVASAGIAAAQSSIVIPYVDRQPVIDGAFSAQEWDGALVIPVDGLTPQQNPGWNPLNGNVVQSADLSYSVSVMHDAANLYVAFDVTDNSVSDDYTTGRPDHTEVWNDDCTEVFIDGDRDRDATESTGGSPLGDRDWREGQQPHFGVLGQHHWENNEGRLGETWWAATTRTANGYRTEYRFAFHGIDTADGEANYAPLEAGDTIGFSVLVNDDDNGGNREDQVAWIGGGTDDSLFRSQQNWGTATLAALPGDPYGIPTRAPNETILIDRVPGAGEFAVTTERTFPRLAFEAPMLVLESPDASGRLFVPELRGRIRSFVKGSDPAPGSVTSFLDISSRVRSPFEGGGESEEGLLGMAFDPDFDTNGELYAYYMVRGGERRSRVSRFTANPPGAATVDPNTEEILLDVPQPGPTHNGGMIAFGPDGFLYIGLGDGGGVDDNAGAGNNAQNTTNLLGSMLRIDVHSAPDPGLAYKIPTTNPYINGGPAGVNTRKEIYAHGLRNPWRWSFDRETGALLCADVGQNQWEEVNVIKSGRNYGWRLMEGPNCYIPAICNPSNLTLPIAYYSHEEGLSITGGFTYYGTEVPDLYGKFLYGDYVTGRIWALSYDPGTDIATTPVEVADLSNFALASFGQDNSGEVYLLNLNDGTIHVLRPTAPPEAVVASNPDPPIRGQQVTITYNATGRILDGAANVNIHRGINGWTNVTSTPMTSLGANRHSITYTVPANATVLDMAFNNGAGTWDNNDTQDWHLPTVAAKGSLSEELQAACAGSRPFPARLSDIPELLDAGLGLDLTHLGIIPYVPSAKLWSDNAEKERFMALPGMTQVTYEAASAWGFPEGTVLIKNFILPLDDRAPQSNLQRIETRLMVLYCGTWYGFSYEWNEAQTDAELLPGAKQRPFTIINEQGTSFPYNWQYPSRDQCTVCHNDAARNVLGISTPVLNSNLTYPASGTTDNQLRALNHISLFTAPLPAAPTDLPSMPNPYDTTQEIRDRARAYLAANCAHCHRPGGGGGGGIDMRWETPDELTNLIDEMPNNSLGIEDARVIAPGSIERSVLYQRMTSLHAAIRMPPLATSRIDEDGSAVVKEWIESLGTPAATIWSIH
jgi:uncharacterized repeat protein (TIGR03806 family)